MSCYWIIHATRTVADLLITLGTVQVSLLLFAPIWLLLYLGVRALCTTRPSHKPLAWLRGVLAWGIVAAHAQVNPRYAPVANWRLFWMINGIFVAALAYALRPDLGAPLAVFVSLWLTAQGLLFAIRHTLRHPIGALAPR
ncbi:MAG: hypothetical protein HGA45_10710 [Chloroflexales bacterium]|nr:hypothetical protein [Chloroflexales bacterium]